MYQVLSELAMFHTRYDKNILVCFLVHSVVNWSYVMIRCWCATGHFQVVFARWSRVLVAVLKQRRTWYLGNVSVRECQVSGCHCSGTYINWQHSCCVHWKQFMLLLWHASHVWYVYIFWLACSYCVLEIVLFTPRNSDFIFQLLIASLFIINDNVKWDVETYYN